MPTGSVAVHQHVEAAALVAVEVLHAEAGAIAGPLAEVLAGQRECRAWQDVGDEALLAEPVDEPLGGVRGRFVHENGTAVPLERVGVGVGLQQGGAVAEVAVGVAQRGQHQVQLLAVVAAAPQRRGGLDEQHLAVGVLAAVRRRARAGRRTATGECRRGAGHDTRCTRWMTRLGL